MVLFKFKLHKQFERFSVIAKELNMAGSFAAPCLHQPVRSISLPSRLHPISQKIEAQLSKLKTWELSSISTGITPLGSETIQVGLTGLAELYNSIKELIQSPLTQKALQQHQSRKLVEETVDGSIGLVDACGTARDLLLNMKRHVQDLQSALRRRGRDSSIKSSVQAYICFRKKARKDIVKTIRALKKMQRDVPAFDLLHADLHVLIVIKVLRELSCITISICRSLFVFLSVPVTKTKANGWSLISRVLMPATFAASDRGQKMFNEVGSVDVTLCSLDGQFRKNGAKIDVQMVQRRLQALDGSVDGLEDGLQCLFRCLIQHRVILLNLLTH